MTSGERGRSGPWTELLKRMAGAFLASLVVTLLGLLLFA